MDKIDMKIDAKVLYQMFEYAAYAKSIFGTEIAGWGHYKKDKGIYKLAPLPKQIVSGAEVDTFPDEIIKDKSYDISDMTVQWHSHVDMGVSPSPTDKKLIKDALELYPFLISIIVNCKHQYYAEVNIRQAGEIVLQSPIQLEINLVPYYDNIAVEKIVKKQCSKPKPVEKAVAISTDRTMRGWHWKYGLGTYIGADFYPDEHEIVVKDTKWNPLTKSYILDENELTVKIEKNINNKQLLFFNDYYGWDDDYCPPAYGFSSLIEQKKDNLSMSEYDIKRIKEKAVKLEKARSKDFQMVCQDQRWWVQHAKSNSYCEIAEEECAVYVNGNAGTWNEFLQKVGAFEEEFWYEPGDCVTCNATGKLQNGKECKVCKGTGELKTNF